MNWRLLEASSVTSHGENPVSLESEWSSVEEFTENLSDAITRDMGTVKETELDRPGFFRKAFLEFIEEGNNVWMDVFTDKLNRIVLPADDVYGSLVYVTFDEVGDDEKIVRRKVVRMEPRYRGDKKSALVVYVESKEGDSDDPDRN